MARLRATHSVAAIFVLASVLFTWPMVQHFTSAVPSVGGTFDPPLQAFILGWDWRALGQNVLGVFDAPIFYPEHRTLGYMDHLLGEATLASPVFALTGSVSAAYNFLVFVSFVLSAWTTYLLARSLRVSRSGALLSGFVFAFSPFRFANLDLLNQLQTEFLPLGLCFALRYAQARRLRDAGGVVGTLVVQVYFGWYYACYLAVALALLAACGLARGAKLVPRAHVWALGVLGVAGLLAVAPVILPYVQQRIAMPEFRRSLGESMLYSADVVDYVRSSPRSVVAGLLRLPVGAQAYWPGFATVPLALFGAWSLWRIGVHPTAGSGKRPNRDLRGGALAVNWLARSPGAGGYFVLLALVSFVLSFGPILQVAGVRTWIPLPYALLHVLVPGFSGMRAPARFAVLTTLACAILGGVGFDYLRRHLGARARWTWRAIAAALFVAAIAGAWQRPIPLLELPTAKTLPPVYAWLAGQHDGAPILELPVPVSAANEREVDALRQYRILFHRHPRLDGCSGFVSHRYADFRLTIQGFPDPRSLTAMAQMGARYIIVHFSDYPVARRAELRGRIAGDRMLVPRGDFGEDAVYELSSFHPVKAGT